MDSAQNSQNNQISRANQNQSNSQPKMSTSQKLAQAILEPEGRDNNQSMQVQQQIQGQQIQGQHNTLQSQQSQQVGQTVADPLNKLIGMVRGKEGQVSEYKVKQMFISVKSKLSHWALAEYVKNFRKEGLTDTQILDLIVELDRQIEENEIDEELFMTLLEMKNNQ